MTTKNEALTVTCPECGAVPGTMCKIKGAPYVEGRIGRNRGYGSGDPDQIGREAKRPHNGRVQAHYHAHLPEAQRVLTWHEYTRYGRKNWTSADDRYQIHEGRTYSVFTRRYGHAEKTWFDLGTYETLDGAKDVAQEHNVQTCYARCICIPDAHAPGCPVPGVER